MIVVEVIVDVEVVEVLVVVVLVVVVSARGQGISMISTEVCIWKNGSLRICRFQSLSLRIGDSALNQRTEMASALGPRHLVQ